MMRISRRQLPLVAIAAVAAAIATPVVAADDPPSPESVAAQRLADQAKLEKAANDLVTQRVEALGLKSDATGKTTLGQKGGEFEGWLLSANAIDAAADSIAADLRSGRAAGGRMVVLAGDEAFDAVLPTAMKLRIKSLHQRASTDGAAAGCSVAAPASEDEFSPEALPVAALPWIGQLIGALKTDTTITGVDGPTDSRLIVNALAERSTAADHWIVPSDISRSSTDSALGKAWLGLAEARASLARCRAAPAGKGKAAQAEAARRNGILDTLLAEIDAFETKQVQGGEGASPLARAIRFEHLGTGPLSVLRVYVEKAGGSVLLRNNLFTMLGAPAVGITGGAVVGWRIVDGTTGEIKGGGNLSCRTALSNMRSIHAGRVRASSCTWKAPRTSSKGDRK